MAKQCKRFSGRRRTGQEKSGSKMLKLFFLVISKAEVTFVGPQRQ